MCTLDCTKAFDRVSLVLLFTKLRERKMNLLVLRCLIYTYCNKKSMHKLEWRQVYTFFSHKWCETRWGAVPPSLYGMVW